MKNRKQRHHRKPRFLNGDNDKRNISIVKANQHVAYHCLFGHGGDVYYIARVLNETWIDPDYTLIVVRKKQVDKNQLNINFDKPLN